MTGTTARKLTGPILLVASHNPGKVREIRELLEPFGLEIVSAGDRGLPEPEETGTTFVANAELKALAAARAAGLPALADDSGFCVDALGGDPGVYSARWAGPSKDFAIAMAKVWEAVQASGSDDRGARFVCALTLAWPDGHTETVEGEVRGRIVWPPRGDKGFGYDPMFVPEGHDRSFGEVDSEWKHTVSHRADAFAKLVDRCLDGGPAS